MTVIQNEHFSPGQICRSGQCFRMEQTGERTYEVTAGGRYLRLEENAGGEVRFCCGAEAMGFWSSYFDLDADYGAFIRCIDENDAYLSRAAAFGGGIRILRQELWEMILSFLISQQNHIPRIRKNIKFLAEQYGERRTAEDGTGFFCFPSPEDLRDVTEEELRAAKLGYRSRYICETTRSVLEGDVRLEEIAVMGYPEARRELMKLAGVGGKVADCICLFALHHLEAFPVDTHISRVLREQYPEGFPSERYEGFQGVLQQYIFYYDLCRGGSPEPVPGRARIYREKD